MRPSTPNFDLPQRAGPSSPPETPTTSTNTFSKTSRSSRRHGVYNFSRPLPRTNGDIHFVGQGSQFNYSQGVRPEDLSPRASAPSSESSGSPSPPRSLSSEPGDGDESPREMFMRRRITVTQGNFVIEEIRDSDAHADSDGGLSVILPNHYEDAESDYAHSSQAAPADLDTRILAEDLNALDCNDLADEREAWIQRKRIQRRINRLSSGSIQKRTISQSIGSDTDDEDMQAFDANEAGSSARRLRRRVGERTSLIFDDDPPQRIVECEEPASADEERLRMQALEPDITVDVEEVLMHALPYYYERDTDSAMELDFEDE